VRSRFGPFTIDSDARQLLRGGAEIHLSRKAFDLLCALIARRPAVVKKHDLLTEIWPDTFVSEANLNVLVGELRRALADDAQAPQFIRTAHGVGFAFCGDVVDGDAEVGSRGVQRARAWLVRSTRTYGLVAGDNVIGRDPRCAVWLDDAGVSRRHAQIRLANVGTEAVVEDLGSTNGTLVRGQRLETQLPLKDGDTLKIGSVELQFRTSTDELPETKRIRRRRSSSRT
jgi:DNA-binding winged helix-turn-helix (wHTH) protein